MYYKIIKDNYVIDICNSWCKLSRKGNLIECKYDEAQFMLGRAPGYVCYRVEWLMPLPENAQEYELFQAIQITQEEYNNLFNSFYNEEQPLYIEEVENIEEELAEESTEVEAPLKILTYSELAKRVNDLTSYCQLLAEQNRLLEDCILEMSQQLYQ